MSINFTTECDILPNNNLKEDFFDVPCVDLAKRLLGKIIVRRCSDHKILKGRIVETESYTGIDDKASFSFNGKVTPRNKPMYMKPGTTFVYMTYGMYYCFNISSRGDGAVVLIRAVEPIEGIEIIKKNRKEFRNKKTSITKKELKIHELCNGPSKFCIGFNIDKNTVNEKDLCSWNEMWVEHDGNAVDVSDMRIVTSKRIGIDSYGEPWASKPFRFYIHQSLSVSKRDKKMEEAIMKIT